MKKLLFSIVLFFLASAAYATAYTVNNTSLTLYAQTTSESNQAHMVESSVGIYNGGSHSSCGNKIYILLEDVDLYAKALATSIAGKKVNVMYVDGSLGQYIAGHVGSLTCKVVSIW